MKNYAKAPSMNFSPVGQTNEEKVNENIGFVNIEIKNLDCELYSVLSL